VTEAIQKEIIAIVADIAGVDGSEIRPDTNFAQDLEIDSIKAIEITVAIEKRFKVSVRDDDVPKIMTLRQAVDLVGQLLQQKSATHGND
jgi:acyl carrier protein